MTNVEFYRKYDKIQEEETERLKTFSTEFLEQYLKTHTKPTQKINLDEDPKQVYLNGKDYYEDIVYELDRREEIKRLENQKIFLKTIDTKGLLNILDHCRAYHGRSDWNGTEYCEYDFDLLKAELATREHIPNGPERKKIRQEKAKLQRSGGTHKQQKTKK